MAEYEVWLDRDDGNRLALLDDFEQLDYTLAANDVGTCQITLPGDWSTTLWAADRKLEVWRKPDGGHLALERVYLLTGIDQQTDRDGLRRVVLEAVDGNDLLRRRLVAYAAGSTSATMTAAADDLMKAIVRQNMTTAATDTDRSWSTGYFSVQTNLSLGPSIVKAYSRRNVLGVLQELSEAAKQTTGPETFFDVPSPEPDTYEFRTHVDQIGLDHTYPDGINPVLLGVEYGNLVEPRLTEDYSEEVNLVYAGGLGQESDRYVYEIEDTVRSGRSIWGRREGWRDSRGDTTTPTQDEGRAALVEGKPKIRFEARVVDCPGTVYGVHWRWGDRISATYGGQVYNAPVNVVQVRRDADAESVEARIGYEE